MYYLGIAIAKTNHVASLMDDKGAELLRNIKFTNSTNGYKKLLVTIQDYLGAIDDIIVGMEATGHY